VRFQRSKCPIRTRISQWASALSGFARDSYSYCLSNLCFCFSYLTEYGRHRRRRVCADPLRRDYRSFQSNRRYGGRGVDRRRHHTSDSRASAHLGRRAQCLAPVWLILEKTVMSSVYRPSRRGCDMNVSQSIRWSEFISTCSFFDNWRISTTRQRSDWRIKRKCHSTSRPQG
jgi:hypothetical protein